MSAKEAQARIKINNLLQESGWRFFDTVDGKSNISLEHNVKFSDMGDDFDKVTNGFIDFLLLDENGKPLVVVEAKKEKIEPLFAKEQARKYAIQQKVKYIILTNGNIHYLWNLEGGNPERIQAFPTLQSLKAYQTYQPQPNKLINETIDTDYIVRSQLYNYDDFPEYNDKATQASFIKKNELRFLRYYQVNAIKSIQNKVKEGKKRFLLEMATGTGKTLTAAAIIKLFYKSGNARRVLFLVDRLELEGQASKDFIKYLKNDLSAVIYKENKDDWRKAEIVITTIQSLLVNNKYKNFSPTDFDLVIGDEIHRLIGGGNSRALFEYFLGYKLGLTATPKDYLKNLDITNYQDPRELERRMLLDTYATFGCEQGIPTFRYTLAEGAKDKILVQPTVIDARTDVTTKLLSEEGYAVVVSNINNNGEEISEEMVYKQNQFERKFFSDETNSVFVKSFLDNGLLDPISKEFGKSLVFAVSQKHAAKITQLLNEYASIKWNGVYNSDFAVQVTSLIPDSQKMTIDFSNDKLLGVSQWGKNDHVLSNYKTSKARVCVTVGMMTTGYDCPNILNLAIMRPIFSPTEFIQIKGRGTRINTFELKMKDSMGEDEIISANKETFKLFDYFAVCEYFEEKYNYDQVLKLPSLKGNKSSEPPIIIDPPLKKDGYDYKQNDFISTFNETIISTDGMKVDRMFFQQFEEKVKQDEDILKAIQAGNMDSASGLTVEKYFNKADEFFTVDKLRKALKIDRKISVRELLEQIFLGTEIKGKSVLMDEEFDKFISTISAENITDIEALRYYFIAYLTDPSVRRIIDNKEFTELYHNPSLPIEDFSRVDDKMRETIPYYINTYLPLDKFANA
jgi:type I restriction enzyme R subunit